MNGAAWGRSGSRQPVTRLNIATSPTGWHPPAEGKNTEEREMQTELAGSRNGKQVADSQASEFLTFRLGAESYGIEILKVQEIRGYETPTSIANAPAFIKGVINLRGVIVPILDLRIKFKLGQVSYDEFTVAIILNIAGRVVGVVVDAVSDVLTLSSEAIRPTRAFASATS